MDVVPIRTNPNIGEATLSVTVMIAIKTIIFFQKVTEIIAFDKIAKICYLFQDKSLHVPFAPGLEVPSDMKVKLKKAHD